MAYETLECRDEVFNSASPEELKQGFRETQTRVQCLICGEIYDKGEVFQKTENILKPVSGCRSTYRKSMDPCCIS